MKFWQHNFAHVFGGLDHNAPIINHPLEGERATGQIQLCVGT